MSYTPITWNTGDILTAAHMNQIEQALAGAAEKTDTVLESSLSMGRKANTVVGQNSVALGYNVTASGTHAHAEGNVTNATNADTHAEGLSTTASGQASHAEGYRATASGNYSHAEGAMTTASGIEAHAEGVSTTASNNYAHAEGDGTSASGSASHSQGTGTVANHKSQMALGEYNVADESTASAGSRGNYVEIVGNGTASYARSNARTLDWNGNEALAGSITLGKGTADETTITAAQLKALLALLSS